MGNTGSISQTHLAPRNPLRALCRRLKCSFPGQQCQGVQGIYLDAEEGAPGERFPVHGRVAAPWSRACHPVSLSETKHSAQCPAAGPEFPLPSWHSLCKHPHSRHTVSQGIANYSRDSLAWSTALLQSSKATCRMLNARGLGGETLLDRAKDKLVKHSWGRCDVLINGLGDGAPSAGSRHNAGRAADKAMAVLPSRGTSAAWRNGNGRTAVGSEMSSERDLSGLRNGLRGISVGSEMGSEGSHWAAEPHEAQVQGPMPCPGPSLCIPRGIPSGFRGSSSTRGAQQTLPHPSCAGLCWVPTLLSCASHFWRGFVFASLLKNPSTPTLGPPGTT